MLLALALSSAAVLLAVVVPFVCGSGNVAAESSHVRRGKLKVEVVVKVMGAVKPRGGGGGGVLRSPASDLAAFR